MMLFDTNAILAAILPHREHHEAARVAFSKSKKSAQACICVHTLAEAYNTLSGKLSIPPQKALELLLFGKCSYVNTSL
jgi:predicted nucleic acid-binding protein